METRQTRRTGRHSVQGGQAVLAVDGILRCRHNGGLEEKAESWEKKGKRRNKKEKAEPPERGPRTLNSRDNRRLEEGTEKRKQAS